MRCFISHALGVLPNRNHRLPLLGPISGSGCYGVLCLGGRFFSIADRGGLGIVGML